MQDTHFSEKDYKFARALWGAELASAPGRTNARGVSILFNNNFEYTILDTRKHCHGNFLALKILIENQFTICLIAMYRPNNDSPEFFGEIRDIVDSFSAHFTILCGDWNLVLSPDLDLYNYNSINNPRSRDLVLNLKMI